VEEESEPDECWKTKNESKRIAPYGPYEYPHHEIFMQQEREREVAEKKKRERDEAQQEEERIQIRRYELYREISRYAS
jgi:hypothetical protein